MPNPILRAGPFASASDSFLDEPETLSSSIVPVNCAINDWVNDSWKFLLQSTGNYDLPFREDGYYDGWDVVFEGRRYTGDGFEDLGGTGPSSGVSGFVRYRFRYQAAVDATIRLSANATAVSDTGGLCNVEVTIGGEKIIDETHPILIDIDEDITLPASVVPNLVFIDVTAEAYAGNNVNAYINGGINLSVPE